MRRFDVKSLFALFLVVIMILTWIPVSSKSDEIEKRRTPVVIIFCDVTNSIDSGSVPAIAQQISDLVLKLPWAAEVSIYPVDCPFRGRIYHYKAPNRPIRTSLEDRYLQEKKKAANYAKKVVNATYKDKYASKMTACSCILETFQVAKNQLSQYDTSKHTFDLIYFSDLLEHCVINPGDTLNFKYDSFEQSQKKIKAFSPDYSLTPMRLTVIIPNHPFATSLDMTISSDQLRLLWQNIFLQVGFSKNDYDNCNFSPDLPHKFDDSLHWLGLSN